MFVFIEVVTTILTKFILKSRFTYAKFSEKLTFLTPDAHKRAYKGVRDVSFPENSA